MAQSNGTPATRRALFALPAVTESVTGNAGQPPVTEPVTGSVTLPLAPLTVTGNTGEPVTETPAGNAEVVPLTPAEHTRLAVAHWAGIAANGAGQLWLHPGRLGHTLWTGKPGSMAEHWGYIKSRAWVPPELDGKPAAFIAGAGIVLYSIAAIAQIPLLILYAALDRMLRLTGLAVLLIVLAVFVVPHI